MAVFPPTFAEKYSRKGKLNEKNSCTPINPKKYSCYGLKKIHTRNLITKKDSCGSEIPHPPHNFSNGPSLKGHSVVGCEAAKQNRQSGDEGQSSDQCLGFSQLKQRYELYVAAKWPSAPHFRHVLGCEGYQTLADSPAMKIELQMGVESAILAVRTPLKIPSAAWSRQNE